jgi:tetratricopeptide (TPR) repeat protein
LPEILEDAVGDVSPGEEVVPDISGEEFGVNDLDLELEDEIPEDDTSTLEFSPDASSQGAQDREDEEMTIDELLAEADVYERYGLADKVAESLEKARAKSPDDPRVLERLTTRGTESGEAVLPPAGETAVHQPAQINADPVTQPVKHDPFEEDLEEADFYHSQGLDDEALRIYKSVLRRDPQHVRALEAVATIEGTSAVPSAEALQQAPDGNRSDAGSDAGAMPSVADFLGSGENGVPDEMGSDHPVETAPPVKSGNDGQFEGRPTGTVRSKLIVEDSTAEDVGGFLDIADELRSELAVEMDMKPVPVDTDGPVSFEDIFSQFKKGIEETLGDEEYETHYNLGIAYKDMGLYDDAIREFQSGARDPALAQDSFSLMAMCFMEKKDYESGVRAVEKALEFSSGDGRTGLLYQMGDLREKQKNWSEAIGAYEQVQTNDPAFEGIAEAIERVKASMGSVGSEEAGPGDSAAEGGMDDMLTDLIREVEEMARESSGEPLDDPGKSKKDRISYL